MAKNTKNKAVTFCKEPLGVGDFEGLPSGGETILLDDESLEVMYGIQETMRTLEPRKNGGEMLFFRKKVTDIEF